MNPHTGQVLELHELNNLRLTNPAEAAKFTVTLDGPPEDVDRIAGAVRDHYSRDRSANRRRNKAARKARRQAR